MSGRNLALRFGLGALFAASLCDAQQYVISTVAGDVTPYYLSGVGDGGPATAAGLGSPAYDVAVDGLGNLYIASGTLIRFVNTSGVISTYAGGGENIGDFFPATSSNLAPTAIAVSGSGTLFIADTSFGTARVRMVTATGTIVTVAGGAQCCALGDGGLATNAYIGIPWGLAIDRSGNLYIAQSDNSGDYRIREVFAGNGLIATVAGGGNNTGDGEAAVSAALLRPSGIAVDTNGNLYIAETGANRVRKVSGGTITTVAAIDSPRHVAVDGSGNLYVTQPSRATVQLISGAGAVTLIAGADGLHGYSGDGGLGTNATMDQPSGVALGSHGALYISDATTGIARVRLLTPATACDVGHYGNTNVADVQMIVNEALGMANPVDDLNDDHRVDVVDVQFVVDSNLGLGCAGT